MAKTIQLFQAMEACTVIGFILTAIMFFNVLMGCIACSHLIAIKLQLETMHETMKQNEKKT